MKNPRRYFLSPAICKLHLLTMAHSHDSQYEMMVTIKENSEMTYTTSGTATNGPRLSRKKERFLKVLAGLYVFLTSPVVSGRETIPIPRLWFTSIEFLSTNISIMIKIMLHC